MDRGAWWVTVHGVAKSRARLSDFTFFLSFYSYWLCILSPHWIAGFRITETMPYLWFGCLWGFFFCWLYCVACWILVPQPGIKPAHPIVEVQNFSYWTTRKVPYLWFSYPKVLHFHWGAWKCMELQYAKHLFTFIVSHAEWWVLLGRYPLSLIQEIFSCFCFWLLMAITC